jgi:hypothetical protein
MTQTCCCCNRLLVPITIRGSHVGLALVNQGEGLDEKGDVVDGHLALGLRPCVEADRVQRHLQLWAAADGHRAVALGHVVPREDAGHALAVL